MSINLNVEALPFLEIVISPAAPMEKRRKLEFSLGVEVESEVEPEASGADCIASLKSLRKFKPEASEGRG